jgi:hypothetical protein
MQYEDLLKIKAFIENHEDEMPLFMKWSATEAVRQLEYWFLDGMPLMNFDPGFYRSIVSRACFSFVEPDPNSDWYLYPEDFPEFYERMLFN